jgi:mono/diheme cytochrome c family protein
MKVLTCALLPIFVAAFASSVDAANDEGFDFFENKIRPILVQHCYECHNSHDKAKGGLALDYKAALLAGGDSGDTIVPGKPDESLLIQSIRHEGGYEMPANSPQLDASIIADFEHWVSLGAPDPRLLKPTSDELANKQSWEEVRKQRRQWWAFQPLEQHAVPQIDAPEWSRNTIDAFVYARMQGEGISPQPTAAPDVLVRRLHLVLTGLPPSPQAVATFLEAPTEQAYEEMVDRLLDSHAFGERWARHWMDWYRYAESHGSEGDPRIPYAQQYRDYVIRALNADVPYDQLLLEHLAGDLLENPRVNDALKLNESAIGPAHLRLVPHGFGVTDAYGEQITFTDNQIDVISKAMLGLTVSCARCHDHKFDPISHKDFYRFYGVMVSNRPSTVLIDSPTKLATNKDELTSLKLGIRESLAKHWLSEIDALPTRLLSDSKQWEDQQDFKQPLGLWNLLQNVDPEDMSTRIEGFLAQLQEIKAANAKSIAEAEFYVDLREPGNAERWFASGNGTASTVSPAGSFALHADGDMAIRGIYARGIYSHLLSDKHAGVLSSANFGVRGRLTQVRAAGSNAQLRVPIRNYPLIHGGLHPVTNVSNERLQWLATQNKWDYWQGEQVHYEIATDRDKLSTPGNNDRSWFGIAEIYAGDQPPQSEGASLLSLVEKPGDITSQGALSDAYRQVLRAAVLAWKERTMSDAQAEFLDDFVVRGLLTNHVNGFPESLQTQIAAYRNLEAAVPVPTRAPGVLEAEPVDHPLLIRGDYKQESEPVHRQFLEIFAGERYDDRSSGRMQLAEDIVSQQNTLKSRVLVNRLWGYVFGRGIVSSTDNFGRLGSKPTHPELLDHLALNFEREGWSIKRTLRKIVTSRTFQSESDAPTSLLEKDPQNIYLSHYTPRRLDAEAIHDSIVQIGGGNERAIYIPVIRNNLEPFLSAFNAPIPTSTISTRNNTNVPAQSLAMLNGQLVEQTAQAWSSRVSRDGTLATPEQKITTMFSEAYSRPPSERELQAMLTYLTGEVATDSRLNDLVQHQQQLNSELAEKQQTRAEIVAPALAKLQQQVDQQNAVQNAEPREPVDLKPIANWDFDVDASDSVGNLNGELVGQAKIADGALVLDGGCFFTIPVPQALREKSLEAVVQLDTLNQSGGGVMTVQTLDGGVFDSIVFAEESPLQWLAGSENWRRTESFKGFEEKDADRDPIHLVFTYASDGTIRAYREGLPYGDPIRKQAIHPFAANEFQVAFGLRHGQAPAGNRVLKGKIHSARLYDRALSPREVIAAATGEHRRIVTREMLTNALAVDQRERLAELEQEIASLESSLAALRLKITQNQPSISGGGYFGIAHALLNSKEFIYVH